MRPTTIAIALEAAFIVMALSSFSPSKKRDSDFNRVQSQVPTDEIKSAALEVLQTKCNTCHIKQNPGKVFTDANMNSLASKINQQVFVKKRMPRGKRLTTEEDIILQNWLNTQNLK